MVSPSQPLVVDRPGNSSSATRLLIYTLSPGKEQLFGGMWCLLTGGIKSSSLNIFTQTFVFSQFTPLAVARELGGFLGDGVVGSESHHQRSESPPRV